MSAPLSEKTTAAAIAALGITVTPDPNAPPAPPERTEEDIERGLADERELRGVTDDGPQAIPITEVLAFSTMVERIKADSASHIDEDIVARAAELVDRDFDKLIEVVKAAGGSAPAFRKAVAQARAAARKASKAAQRPPAFTSDAPKILIRPNELEVANEAIAALAGDLTLYQRGPMLVRIRVDLDPELPPVIQTLPEHTLRERLSGCINWYTVAYDDQNRPKEIAEHPPSWAVKAILSRGEWAGIRPLKAITACPLFRLDGTILSAPGYDALSRYAFIPPPGVDYPEVPENPTDAQVQESIDLIIEPYHDFEFDTQGPFDDPQYAKHLPEGVTAAEQNKRLNLAACVAHVMTLLARPAIKGPVPFTAYDACTPGTGKTLCCRISTCIGTGQEMVTEVWVGDPDEDRKAALGHLRDGDKSVVFDNITGVVGNGVIDALCTAWPTFGGRVLGTNDNAKFPALTMWCGTGNQLRFRNDTIRRTLRASLRSTYDDPSDRDPDSFKHKDLMEWVEQNRPRLVVAALTIIRAWVVAGRPRKKLRPWPSFEAWAAIVPQVLAWIGFPDIGLTQVDLQKSNEARTVLAKLIEGWEVLCAMRLASDPTDTAGPWPRTSEEALNALKNPDNAETLKGLREAIEELNKGKPFDKLYPSVLGKLLAAQRGSNSNGKALFKARCNANNAWEIQRVRVEPTIAPAKAEV